jgi:hypothetical protein
VFLCFSFNLQKQNKKLSDVFKKSEFITKFIAQLATSRKERRKRKEVSFRFSLSLFYNPEHKKAKLLLRINIFMKNHFFASLIVEKGSFLVSFQVKNCGLKVTEVVLQFY